MSKYPPAFQLYPADLLTGTAEWSNSEFGAYVRLLCHQWINGTIPADASACAKLCSGDKKGVNLALKTKFKTNGNGRAFNARLESVRDEQVKYRKAQSMRAHMRWDKERICPPDALQSSPSSSNTPYSPPQGKERRKAILKRVRNMAIEAIKDEGRNPDLSSTDRTGTIQRLNKARSVPSIFAVYREVTGHDLT